MNKLNKLNYLFSIIWQKKISSVK